VPVNDEIAAPPVVISSLTLKYEVNDEIAARGKGLSSLTCARVRHRIAAG
jgi:hypothetical protein